MIAGKNPAAREIHLTDIYNFCGEDEIYGAEHLDKQRQRILDGISERLQLGVKDHLLRTIEKNRKESK